MKYLCALRDLIISLVASTIIIYGLNIVAGFAGADYSFTNGEAFIIWILMEGFENKVGGGIDIHIISNNNALLTTLQIILSSFTVFCER